jgi:hypothetical protein
LVCQFVIRNSKYIISNIKKLLHRIRLILKKGGFMFIPHSPSLAAA